MLVLKCKCNEICFTILIPAVINDRHMPECSSEMSEKNSTTANFSIIYLISKAKIIVFEGIKKFAQTAFKKNSAVGCP